MLRILLFAVGASLPLFLGAALGVVWSPPRKLLGILMVFATGALLSAVAYELFLESQSMTGTLGAAVGFAGGAATFVLADTLIDHWNRASGGVGFALLAGTTMDGLPENAALGVTLTEGGSIALLAAIFISNFPESLGGAVQMRQHGRSRRSVLIIWAVATVALAAAVVAGRWLLAPLGTGAVAVPLAFAGGAVLASVVDALAPEAFREGGPLIALASAAGFIADFTLGH
ncbi:zinc permease [Blastococcus sp. TF02-8]|uniref:ZIP family metal transporter n=1 Tax=Blastococcus sp. TF02-8 TaxID=2250574 RepID=UPI000DE811D4|nr:zinc permease [Blastococcus sp. TF02-8]RBY93576.1 zinc permease [Blastococcus sp. TF02-8]